MKDVYAPGSMAEAHMLAHLLESDGIKAHILGEALQGAAGELPATGLLRICVADEDFERARTMLLDWEVREATSDSIPARRFPSFVALVFLVAGLAAGWVGKTLLANTPFRLTDNKLFYDNNGDGKTDLTYFYEIGASQPFKSESDRNFDGTPDVVTHFDGDGDATREDIDDDFDGRMEAEAIYANGSISRFSSDKDEDGSSEVELEYENGVLTTERLFDPATGALVRLNVYGPQGQIAKSEVDLDRDGKLETARSFDFFGEVVSEERTIP